MTYDITNTNVIYLGRQGENLARTVEIDVNSILGKWPNATISLLVQRNQEDTFYLAPVVIENGILKWTISSADTEFAGDGKAEIRATQDDVIVKSAMMNTHVSDSLGGTETDIPDPAQTWADTIIAASEQAKQSAEDALASELAAKEAAESITELESNIKTAEAARVEAEKERISAENERIDAEIARSNAETSRAFAEHERQTAEGTRVSAETSRETAENNRVAAETARVTAEQSRASAETARESAETDRQTTFETNEAQRQTAFETAEAGRAAAESSRVAAEESRVSAEAERVEAESERVTAENQRAETFAGYETRIDAATPDDSTVDGKPWTSRKIVDTLCPPFDVSGSAVTCHPVERYPLDVVSRIDATQSGTGDPSPDNIRPIVGWDSVSLNRCGKNLLKASKTDITKELNGIICNYTANNDTFTIKGTNKASSSFVIFSIVPYVYPYFKPGEKYTMSNNSPNGVYVQITYINTSGNLATLVYSSGTQKTFTVPENYIRLNRLQVGISASVNTIDTTFNIHIELGPTATTYEPYIGDTYTAELPETIYGGELDWSTGVLTVDKVMITLTGNETWRFRIPGTQPNTFLHAYGKRILNGICTHYKGINVSELTNGYDGIYLSYTMDIIVTDHRFDTVEAFKAYLAEQNAAGTPVQVCYKLETPYTIQLTPQQIAALPGVNTLYTDSGDISVSGRTDMIWLTQSLIDRIAALETAAVSE